MESTTASSAPGSKAGRNRRGFSLVELMVASSEGVLLMSLVLAVLVTCMSVGASVGNYSDMSAQARIAMSQMESDLRAVSQLTTATTTRLDCEVVTAVIAEVPTINTISYYYDSGSKSLYRESPTGSNKRLVMSDVKNCQFVYFNGSDAPASDAITSKKILIYAEMERRNVGKINTDNIVSAVVVMRSR